MTRDELAPGSRAAIDAGCTCPVLDNAHGAGVLIDGRRCYWYAAGCPVHAGVRVRVNDTTRTRATAGDAVVIDPDRATNPRTVRHRTRGGKGIVGRLIQRDKETR